MAGTRLYACCRKGKQKQKYGTLVSYFIFCILLKFLNVHVSGQAEEFLVEKDKQSQLSSIAEGRCPELKVKSRRVSEKPKRSPLLELYPGPRLLPSAKIKLQLFPLDEGTRMGLEKVNYRTLKC